MFEIGSELFNIVKRRNEYEYTNEFDEDILVSMNVGEVIIEEAGVKYTPANKEEKLFPIYSALLSIHVGIDMDRLSSNDVISSDILRYTQMIISAENRVEA